MLLITNSLEFFVYVLFQKAEGKEICGWGSKFGIEKLIHWSFVFKIFFGHLLTLKNILS